jgi:hypothetical protein
MYLNGAASHSGVTAMKQISQARARRAHRQFVTTMLAGITISLIIVAIAVAS